MHTESKRCIYHYPGEIIASGIGSALRPYKMLEAFIQLGYEVDVVSGSSAERKRIMKQIRRKICSGVKYDFLYAEDRNMRYRMMTIYRGIPLLISLSLDFANRQKYLLEFFIVMLIGGFRCLEK